MRSEITTGVTGAPSPILLQTDRVRRRIAVSDSVAALLSELAFGTSRRGDVVALASVTADRVTAAGVGCR